MRGLTPSEEEMLELVLRNATGATECGPCELEPTAELTFDDGVFLALHKRGLLYVVACRTVSGQFHISVTDLGKLALRLASATRSLEP